MLSANNLPEIMTPVAVLEMLDISRATLTRLQRKGMLPYYKFGKKVYFRRSEIMDAVTANRVQVKAVQSTSKDVQQAA